MISYAFGILVCHLFNFIKNLNVTVAFFPPLATHLHVTITDVSGSQIRAAKVKHGVYKHIVQQ